MKSIAVATAIAVVLAVALALDDLVAPGLGTVLLAVLLALAVADALVHRSSLRGLERRAEEGRQAAEYWEERYHLERASGMRRAEQVRVLERARGHQAKLPLEPAAERVARIRPHPRCSDEVAPD